MNTDERNAAELEKLTARTNAARNEYLAALSPRERSIYDLGRSAGYLDALRSMTTPRLYNDDPVYDEKIANDARDTDAEDRAEQRARWAEDVR